MRFKIYSGLALCSMLITFSIYGQSADDHLIEQFGELIGENLEENFDLSDLAERLDFYRRNPIDLNKTNGDELRELLIVPQLFIDNLLAHRRQSGTIISFYELQAVEGLDLAVLRLLEPFVTINTPPSLSDIPAGRLLSEGKHDLMIRYGRILQKQTGYTVTDTSRSRYLGSPDRLFFRYRYHFGRDLQVALNMKKDAGERFFGGAQRGGFDFYSASLAIRNQGRIKDLVIGDYALQFGQGLAMWSGLAFGKGPLIQNAAKQATGLRPYTSSNEVLFFRGAAATVAIGNNLSVTPFFSRRKLDGTMQHAIDSTFAAATLGQTGLHRTPHEAENKNALRQWVYGLNARYARRKFQIGAAMFRTVFDAPISPRPLLRNRYAFNGRSLWNASLHYSTSLRNAYFFGEAAHHHGGGFAWVNGAIVNLHHHLGLVLLHRNYQRDYHSFYGQAFAAGNTNANEQGFYSGLSFQPSRRVSLVLYADFFRFPWLRYRVDAPSRGTDILTQFAYEWYKRAEVSVRYRYRQKQENAAVELAENQLVNVNRQQIRLSGSYRVNGTWHMRNRLELTLYRKEGETAQAGWLMYQDVFYKPLARKLGGNLRVALFRTSDYQSGIYAYENNVLYAYSYPVYHNKGLRAYANIRYRFFKNMDLWVRYATFIYHDTNEIGTGLDKIAGRQKSELTLQFRLQL